MTNMKLYCVPLVSTHTHTHTHTLAHIAFITNPPPHLRIHSCTWAQTQTHHRHYFYHDHHHHHHYQIIITAPTFILNNNTANPTTIIPATIIIFFSQFTVKRRTFSSSIRHGSNRLRNLDPWPSGWIHSWCSRYLPIQKLDNTAFRHYFTYKWKLERWVHASTFGFSILPVFFFVFFLLLQHCSLSAIVNVIEKGDHANTSGKGINSLLPSTTGKYQDSQGSLFTGRWRKTLNSNQLYSA